MPGKFSGTERRRFVRVSDESILQVEPFTMTGTGPRIKGFTKTISEGGLLFETVDCFNLGCILKLEVSLPGWERFKSEFAKNDRVTGSRPLVVLAKVVRAEDVGGGLYDIGVVFSAVDSGHRLALRKYISTALAGK